MKTRIRVSDGEYTIQDGIRMLLTTVLADINLLFPENEKEQKEVDALKIAVEKALMCAKNIK